MHRWELFIDESGDLSTDGQWSVVAGVLMRKPIPDHRLRDALERGALGVRHPHHAAVCNRLTGLLAARELAGSADAPTFELAIEAMGRAPARLRQPYRDALEGGRVPEYTILRQLDAWMQEHHRAAWERMSKEKDSHYGRFRTLCNAVAERGQAHIVAAATRERGGDEEDAVMQGDVSTRPRTDRYLSCLRTLLERVVLMARDGKRRQIDISVATRDVDRPGYPRTPLTVADVGGAVRDVIAYPCGDTDSAFEYEGLRLRVVSTPKYDAGAPAGLVLADYAANRLHASLLHAGVHGPAWRRLARDARYSVEMHISAPAPSHPGAPPLPMIACDGPARDLLRAGLVGKDVNANEIPSSWVRTQVERWLEVSP